MPLPEDIQEATLNNPKVLHILSRRIDRRFYALWCEILKRLPEDIRENPDPQKAKDLQESFRGVITVKELDNFSRELDRYKTKHRRDYFEDIEKAFTEKEGRGSRARNQSLVRILSWDKEWLAIREVQERIIKAQEEGEFEFLKDIGEAVGLQPGCIHKPKKDADLIKKLRLFADRYPSETKETEFLKGMQDYLYENEKAGDDPKLQDFDYFMKWLRRNEVI